MKEITGKSQLLAERLTGIGGSDIGGVLSLKPYGCARKTWYEKRSIPPDVNQIETNPMKRGTRLEEVAAEEYASATGRKLRRMSLRRHKENLFLIVHIDRSIVSTNGRGPGVLEIKCPGDWAFRKVKQEGLPEAYILQLQHAMLVTGRQWGSYAIFWADGWELLYWDVERDEEICKQIVAAAAEFWKRVENGPAPDRLEPTDRRCATCAWRTQCQGGALLEAVPGLNPGEEIPEDPTLQKVAGEYLEAKGILNEAKEIRDGAHGRLCDALGERGTVRVDGTLFRYKPQISTRFNIKSFRTAHPKLADKYRYKSVSRPLRDYPV